MITYKDIISGDELFSNTHNVEELEDENLIKVECTYFDGGPDDDLGDAMLDLENEHQWEEPVGLKRCEMTGEEYKVQMNGYFDELKRKWEEKYDEEEVEHLVEDFRFALEQIEPKLANARFYACPDVYPKMMRPGLIGVFEEGEISFEDSKGGFMYFPLVAIEEGSK